jgi:outer membrane protein
LNGQYRFTNETGLSGRSSNWSVGLTLNWSLFDGFSRTADFREKKALAHIADLDLQEARRRIDVEVRNALITLKNQQASTKQAAVALEVARKNAAETTELFRQGLTGALEAADANVSLYEAEVGFIRERFGLAIAFLNLRLALGIGPFGQNSENGKKNIKDRTAKEF